MIRKRLNQAGDTIVEVLIALAVLGAIIGGGYAVATRSLNGVQVAQERTEATKVAEGQLEAIRSTVATSPSLASFVAAGYIGMDATWLAFDPGLTPPEGFGFCVTDTGAAYQMDNQGGRVLVRDIDADKKDLSKYPPECRLGANDRYHTFVTTSLRQLNYSPTADTYQLTYNVQIFWDGVNGGQESLHLNNRFNFSP